MGLTAITQSLNGSFSGAKVTKKVGYTKNMQKKLHILVFFLRVRCRKGGNGRDE